MKLNRKHIIDTNVVYNIEGSATKTSLDRPMLLFNALSRHIEITKHNVHNSGVCLNSD